MIRSLCRSEHAVANQASSNTTSDNKDFANHLDLLLIYQPRLAFRLVVIAKALLVLAVTVEQQPLVLLPALLEQRKQATVRSLGCVQAHEGSEVRPRIPNGRHMHAGAGKRGGRCPVNGEED